MKVTSNCNSLLFEVTSPALIAAEMCMSHWKDIRQSSTHIWVTVGFIDPFMSHCLIAAETYMSHCWCHWSTYVSLDMSGTVLWVSCLWPIYESLLVPGRVSSCLWPIYESLMVLGMLSSCLWPMFKSLEVTARVFVQYWPIYESLMVSGRV